MAVLPTKYKYLTAEDMPLTIKKALQLYGTSEILGSKHSQTIIGWAKEVGIEDIYKEDEMAWCGLAIAVVMKRAGKLVSMKGYDLLRALQWQKFGKHTAKAGLGDVLVFKRAEGGHVGLYVGEDWSTYHVLGGNQSNQFNIIRIEKTRCVAIRRPLYTNQPSSVKAVDLSPTGLVSRNEA